MCVLVKTCAPEKKMAEKNLLVSFDRENLILIMMISLRNFSERRHPETIFSFSSLEGFCLFKRLKGCNLQISFISQ